jgi:hypothetical protein
MLRKVSADRVRLVRKVLSVLDMSKTRRLLNLVNGALSASALFSASGAQAQPSEVNAEHCRQPATPLATPSTSMPALAAQSEPAMSATLSEQSPVSKNQPRRNWYGWQTLVVDATALAAGVAAGATENWPAFYGVYGGYLLGGPIVHAAHHRWDEASISIAARFFVPVLALGATIAPGEGRPTVGPEVAATMIAVGVLVPIVVDAVILSWEDPKSLQAYGQVPKSLRHP